VLDDRAALDDRRNRVSVLHLMPVMRRVRAVADQIVCETAPRLI